MNLYIPALFERTDPWQQHKPCPRYSKWPPRRRRSQPAPIATPSSVASENSLFELDTELDLLLEQIEDEIEEHGEATPESMNRMQLFCLAMNVKVDRIGHYIIIMEIRVEYCRKQASRYAQRASRGQSKIDRTKKMVLEYLAIHEMKKIESNDFTLRSQKNSQDSVIIKNPAAVRPS
jgi:Siphovirus Gp157